MITLAIDTAAPRLQLGLLRADGSVDISVDEIATGHAELIFARIATLLERNGLTYADLARVAVTTGPGSFTGLRIGLSAPAGEAVSVLVDARRDEAYFQNFSAPGQPLGAAQLLAMDAARAAVLPGATLLETPFVDIALLAAYGATVDPATHQPEPDYIRDADAKPQTAARIARITP